MKRVKVEMTCNNTFHLYLDVPDETEVSVDGLLEVLAETVDAEDCFRYELDNEVLGAADYGYEIIKVEDDK